MMDRLAECDVFLDRLSSHVDLQPCDWDNLQSTPTTGTSLDKGIAEALQLTNT